MRTGPFLFLFFAGCRAGACTKPAPCGGRVTNFLSLASARALLPSPDPRRQQRTSRVPFSTDRFVCHVGVFFFFFPRLWKIRFREIRHRLPIRTYSSVALSLVFSSLSFHYVLRRERRRLDLWRVARSLSSGLTFCVPAAGTVLFLAANSALRVVIRWTRCDMVEGSDSFPQR